MRLLYFGWSEPVKTIGSHKHITNSFGGYLFCFVLLKPLLFFQLFYCALQTRGIARLANGAQNTNAPIWSLDF